MVHSSLYTSHLNDSDIDMNGARTNPLHLNYLQTLDKWDKLKRYEHNVLWEMNKFVL